MRARPESLGHEFIPPFVLSVSRRFFKCAFKFMSKDHAKRDVVRGNAEIAGIPGFSCWVFTTDSRLSVTRRTGAEQSIDQAPEK
jgi:hypothetical protein